MQRNGAFVCFFAPISQLDHGENDVICKVWEKNRDATNLNKFPQKKMNVRYALLFSIRYLLEYLDIINI